MAADGGGGTRLPESPPQPIIDPAWLAARAPVDASARAATLDNLLPKLIDYLIEDYGLGRTIKIIDLGAGTGANQRWLTPRLPFPQHWIHLDHDPAISRWVPLPDGTMIIDGSVEALGHMLGMLGGEPCLVTCSAVLDVLTTDQLAAVCRAVIDNEVPALFSLTVTGAATMDPASIHDQPLLAAFNDHQRRVGRAGPDAVALAVNALSAGGFAVHTQETPWQLTASSDSVFVEQLLQERLEAAVAQDPSVASEASTWFELRCAQLALGMLRIEVGHRDILALPMR